MPVKAKRQRTAKVVDEPVTVSAPDNDEPAFPDEAAVLALALIDACLADDEDRARELVGQGADAWVQDSQGWTALHCAASTSQSRRLSDDPERAVS